MSKIMLIDGAHSEEVRVVIASDGRLEEFISEASSRKSIKGNIYLAKIIRIEPSLQAAFVDYGGARHGFLPFGEIHPDYYQIPVADREKMLKDLGYKYNENDQDIDENLINRIEDLGNNDIEIISEPKLPSKYRYKIQEVIKRGQILLIQIVKEERGSKGASLTTYLTLAGRYCVLMPNSGNRNGGISRKISSNRDRNRLKKILDELSIPSHMSVIVRTAGQLKKKSEIKRDYDYLLKTWEEIRLITMKSVAPSVIYSEGELIKKAIRDIYGRDIELILIEGEESYKAAKAYIKTLISSHSKKVRRYKSLIPIFQAYGIESQINNILDPRISLPSGGSIVIDITEALIAIDVNSGKSTRERHIDDTAFKTNLEASEEIARQIRLRDLSGLIVVDFIDMHERKHIQFVEKKFRESVKLDRARIQVGHISEFGLLELSRQRLRPNLIETNTTICKYCEGTGIIRTTESISSMVLRSIESEILKNQFKEVLIDVSPGVDLYLLNQKRSLILDIENKFDIKIYIQRSDNLKGFEFRISGKKEPSSCNEEDKKDGDYSESNNTPKSKEVVNNKKKIKLVSPIPLSEKNIKEKSINIQNKHEKKFTSNSTCIVSEIIDKKNKNELTSEEKIEEKIENLDNKEKLKNKKKRKRKNYSINKKLNKENEDIKDKNEGSINPNENKKLNKENEDVKGKNEGSIGSNDLTLETSEIKGQKKKMRKRWRKIPNKKEKS